MSKASLNEVMGKAGDKSGNLTLKDLPDILGTNMPELPRNRVGRFRLVRALQQRFGASFRSLPGVSGIMKEFDSEVDFEGLQTKLKKIKPQGSK